jgi:hypothetical protein
MTRMLSIPHDYVEGRWVPRHAIQTTDAASGIRTHDPGRPLFGPDDAVRSATRRERGRMTRDDDEPVRVGVGQSLITPPPRISLGRVWTGIADAARAAGVDPEDLDLTEEQVQGLMAAVVDALKRRRARDQEREPAAGRSRSEKEPNITEDARRPSIHAAAAQATRDWAASLPANRAALTAAPGAAPAAKARCSGPDFARLHDKSALRRAAEGRS